MRFLAVHCLGSRVGAGAVGAVALSAAACALTLAACGSVPATGSTPSAAGTPAPPATVAKTPAGKTPAGKTPGKTPAGTAAGVGDCTTAQLKVAITHTGALGGQAGGYLRFTNDGAATCLLNGWPSVVALTAAGKATTLKHAQATMYGAWHVPAPLPVVRLHPGGSAYAVVASDDQPAGPSGGCPAPYVRLRVSPPGSSGSSGSMIVSAWLPGAETYLPSCTALNGSPTGEVSAITPLSSLPH